MDLLTHAPPSTVYLALVVLLLVEGTGMPWVPYEPVFLAAGFLIQAGRMSLPVTLALGAVANLAGNIAGYHIGKTAGRYLVDRYGRYLGIGPEQLALAERWFHRYGALTNFIGRFFGVIRTPAIIGAGLARMDLRRFAVWNAAGGTLWTFVWLYASVVAGRSLRHLAERYGIWIILATLALLPLAILAFHRLSRFAQGRRQTQG